MTPDFEKLALEAVDVGRCFDGYHTLSAIENAVEKLVAAAWEAGVERGRECTTEDIREFLPYAALKPEGE